MEVVDLAGTFYSKILLDHNAYPTHKHTVLGANYEEYGQNPSCGDEVFLHIYMDSGKIKDGGFTGDGCAISQASTDLMFDLLISKTKDEALRLIGLFRRMITGDITEKEREELGIVSALEEVKHMPSRRKCALLGWETLEKMLEKFER